MGAAHDKDSFFVEIGPKTIYQIIFRTTGLQHKLLILIESPDIFHWKSAKKGKWVWSLGKNLGQIVSSVVKKQRNWDFNRFLSYFA